MIRLTKVLAAHCFVLASIYAQAATPTILRVFPEAVTAGTTNVPLAVVGTKLTAGAVLLVNGTAEPTTIAGNQLAVSYLPVVPAVLHLSIRNTDGVVSAVYAVPVTAAVTSTSTSSSSGTSSSGTSSSSTSSGTSSGSTSTGSTTSSSTASGGTSSGSTTSGSTSTGSTTTTATTSSPTASSSSNTVWYVRTDGGTRYSVNQTTGQCDGKSNAAYPGTGYNQHCAFGDVRYLWTDGSYTVNTTAGSPTWGWIGTGGDTYVIEGSIAQGVSYRVGQSGPNSGDYFGLAGNPYGAGAPPPLSGTAAAHTKILGGNYGSCTAQSARTQLHGGYGVGAVLNMSGVSYVDVACLDITDFSSCGRAGQVNSCNTQYPISDYATNGIVWSNKSTNDTVTDVRVHGLASAGMLGSTGTGVEMTDIAVVGNAGAGWNADAGDGTTGTGTLLVQNFNISWNGCTEEYPIVDALPYQDCTDDNAGGYGDGFGTATVASSPGWQAHFDQGVVSYNTQDGLDALHLTGTGSSMTITRVLAYGNMGQQIKVGGASGTALNNVLVTNCNALRQTIPGTPSGYNSRLSDFCRAADTGIVTTVGRGSTLTFDSNTIYSASATAFEIACDTTNGDCDKTSLMDFRNNVFVGFLNNAADGYPSGGTGDYSNPIYDGTGLWPLGNPGSTFTNNLTFHAKSNWTCPANAEQNAICGVDPLLTDEVWHNYGYNNAEPLAGAPVLSRGIDIPSITVDFNGTPRENPPTLGAIEK